MKEIKIETTEIEEVVAIPNTDDHSYELFIETIDSYLDAIEFY